MRSLGNSRRCFWRCAKGYNLIDIAAHFGQQGITVSASTLGSYLRDRERKGTTPKENRRNTRRRAAKTTPVPAVVEPEQLVAPPGVER